MNKKAKCLAGWVGGTALLIGMPLLGVWLSGHPLSPYLQMPPRTDFVLHAAFSWPVFWGLAVCIVTTLGLFVVRIIMSNMAWASCPCREKMTGHFPWWGWCALLFGATAWILAWTRFPWFKPFQPFTFTPLWLAYIVVMNALTFRRTGRSPLTHQARSYLTLFPISAVFWWFFEYLNRFVQNWHYVGLSTLTAEEYVCRAMLPFATVLPAFAATRAWLASYPCLTTGLTSWRPPIIRHPHRLAWLTLLLAATGLAGISLWPEYLFPLLWISPLIIIGAIRGLNGTPTLLNDPGRGDWRRLIQAAAAALVCGFFWEMWNVLSLEKWIYTVPFVARFHIFEMPLLGYTGYLPFGIECALIAELVGVTGKEDDNTEVRRQNSEFRIKAMDGVDEVLVVTGVSPVGTQNSQDAAGDGGYYTGECKRPRVTRVLLAVVMVIIAVTGTSSLSLRRMAFCAPAAHLAGLLSGAPCARDGHDYRLIGTDLDLAVIPACAATDYFCLLTGFLSLLFFWRAWPVRSQLLVLPAAWALTILINAIRLTACWQTDRLAQALLPPSVWPATHMAVGVVTFLTGLILVFWLMRQKVIRRRL